MELVVLLDVIWLSSLLEILPSPLVSSVLNKSLCFLARVEVTQALRLPLTEEMLLISSVSFRLDI